AAVADALALAHLPECPPLAQVVSHLRGRPWLLVLDNFEHLVESGALLARTLLERVPTLTLLVTSRQRLGLSGEQELVLLPLPTPGRAWVRHGRAAPGPNSPAPLASRIPEPVDPGRLL